MAAPSSHTPPAHYYICCCAGKGAGGTFALVDGTRKTGAKFEDAIESAIIAMNEPKDASVNAIRDYLGSLVYIEAAIVTVGQWQDLGHR